MADDKTVTLPERARVVVIGGGAVGASVLFHLGRAGWSDCLLLERNELTAGSTWHAAGNIPTFSSSWMVMAMQRYSTELYRGLAEAVDYPMNYHVSGAVRLAHTKARVQEFERVAAMGRHQGMDLEMMTPDEVRAAHPFTELHDLAGGMWDPMDGDIDPAQLTQALAKGARMAGGKIVRFCPVTGARREGADWVVETGKGEVRCDYVVNAAGYYAGKVGEMLGRRAPLPQAVMSHQYILFDEIDEVKAWSAEQGRKLPLLRDVDSSYYLRQEKNGMNLGPYERDARAMWLDEGVPEDFSFQLRPDDLDRLDWYREDAMARMPLLGTTGLTRVVNGPIPYAPDGLPLIGPMPGAENAFEACTFTFGICQAGGAGKIVAEYITEGAPDWDCWDVDPRRFTAHASEPDYAVAKAKEVYGHEYAIHFPRLTWPAGRPQKTSPAHGRLDGLGAVWGAVNGWERALWYAAPGDDTSREAAMTWDRAGPWEARVRAECEAVRDGCGVLDLCGFSRFALSGDGAAAWLSRQITGALPKVGRMTLGYFADERGRIVTEMSVMRTGEDSFTLITAASGQWHDFDWLSTHLEPGLDLIDRTEEVSTLLVTGPAARDLLSRLTDGDLSLPWLSHQSAIVAGEAVVLARVSFAGELGWEIHAPNAAIPTVLEAVLAAGAVPFGMLALDSMRIEKGYRTWKGDLS
ncbi:MAG: FAD-dependent oxidoreductase, partial [Pseudomonadota bacterium]